MNKFSSSTLAAAAWVPTFDDIKIKTNLNGRKIALKNRQRGKSSTTVLVVESSNAAKTSEIDISEIEGRSEEIEQGVYDFWARGRAK